MNTEQTQASPIEMAALLMDAVCAPTDREEEALVELVQHLQVPVNRIQSELLYLRAFAVDFAAVVGLAESREKEAILTHYQGHWELIGREAGSEVLSELSDRMSAYSEAIGDAAPNPEGLRGCIGSVFSQLCSTEDRGEDLAILGGAMFAGIFEEVADLFSTVDIVLPSGE